MSEDYSMRGYKGWDTRRLYLFESTSKVLKPYQKQIPLKDLVRYGRKIWTDIFHYRTNNFPEFRFGPGIKHGTGMTSFYHWYNHDVEFAPGERNIVTLAHEMCHAYGREDHDYEFVFQELRIFDVQFNINPKLLSDEATLFNLPYQPCLE